MRCCRWSQKCSPARTHKGIESALNWLQAQPGYTTSRNRWLMRLLMARVSEQYGKNEMALHLLAELDSRAREMTLEQWEAGAYLRGQSPPTPAAQRQGRAQ